MGAKETVDTCRIFTNAVAKLAIRDTETVNPSSYFMC
jgi:hypothetical protein